MRRALKRASLTEESLRAENLRHALEALRSTLRVYHDDEEAERRLGLIEALCTPSELAASSLGAGPQHAAPQRPSPQQSAVEEAAQEKEAATEEPSS